MGGVGRLGAVDDTERAFSSRRSDAYLPQCRLRQAGVWAGPGGRHLAGLRRIRLYSALPPDRGPNVALLDWAWSNGGRIRQPESATGLGLDSVMGDECAGRCTSRPWAVGQFANAGSNIDRPYTIAALRRWPAIDESSGRACRGSIICCQRFGPATWTACHVGGTTPVLSSGRFWALAVGNRTTPSGSCPPRRPPSSADRRDRRPAVLLASHSGRGGSAANRCQIVWVGSAAGGGHRCLGCAAAAPTKNPAA